MIVSDTCQRWWEGKILWKLNKSDRLLHICILIFSLSYFGRSQPFLSAGFFAGNHNNMMEFPLELPWDINQAIHDFLHRTQLRCLPQQYLINKMIKILLDSYQLWKPGMRPQFQWVSYCLRLHVKWDNWYWWWSRRQRSTPE